MSTPPHHTQPADTGRVPAHTRRTCSPCSTRHRGYAPRSRGDSSFRKTRSPGSTAPAAALSPDPAPEAWNDGLKPAPGGATGGGIYLQSRKKTRLLLLGIKGGYIRACNNSPSHRSFWDRSQRGSTSDPDHKDSWYNSLQTTFAHAENTKQAGKEWQPHILWQTQQMKRTHLFSAHLVPSILPCTYAILGNLEKTEWYTRNLSIAEKEWMYAAC